MSFFVVSLFITLYQKHTLFWSIYTGLCFILHLEKQIFALHICLITISKGSYASPWNGRLRILHGIKRISSGRPQSSQLCGVFTWHSWFICLSDFQPQWAHIWLHGNEPLKWQKEVLTHPKQRSPLKNSLWWNIFWTVFWIAFRVTVWNPQERMPHLITEAHDFWRKIVWPSWWTTVSGKLCLK